MTPMMTLVQAAEMIPGAQLTGAANLSVNRVHTDTRTIEPGDLFVALKGERYDANQFLAEAQERGAVGVVCHKGADPQSYPPSLPRIEVDDTKAALGLLAKHWRAQFDLPLIAVTGSNGKTTVTQMIASILQVFAPGGDALATQGNLNNDIGVPLTLLRLRRHHRIAVVELGMNHPGEIAVLAAMVQPTVALVNNAQREHLEFMHTVEAVARENGAAISALATNGIAVFPADDAFTNLWVLLSGERDKVTFSAEGGAELKCLEAHWSRGAWAVRAQHQTGELTFRLAIAGRHNVKNALAAAACAMAAGVPVNAVVNGLESFVPVKGRSRAMTIQVGTSECALVDDTYNANPDSVRAAINVLAELPKPQLLVLGDMGEVGNQGPTFHAEAGSYAHAKGIDRLFVIGMQSRVAAEHFAGAQHFESMESLADAVNREIPGAGSVLVKGSRFMRMERVVESVVGAYPCC
jgi:UDP-N-acetylmuramoyl-tripeptide--D-alanyl-D-alanine ligase